MGSGPFDRLRGLVESGQLRFVYVIGVARSSSTILCRLLGAQLDGAVYEPATPAAFDRQRHFARIILVAYDRARRQIGPGRPVALAIKDLSLFLDHPEMVSLAGRAAHLVFAIRQPAAQQASLRRQLAHEFSPLQRIDAVLRHPFEALWMAWHFVVYGRRFVRVASPSLGYSFRRLPRLAMAGWNLESWRNMEAQIAALSHVPMSVIDADELRRDPDASARIAGIAASVVPDGQRANVEVPGHSRMLPRSRWASEALSSHSISPAAATPVAPPEPDAFDEALLAITGAAYGRIRCAADLLAR